MPDETSKLAQTDETSTILRAIKSIAMHRALRVIHRLFIELSFVYPSVFLCRTPLMCNQRETAKFNSRSRQ
jgi:hypothetical protein